MRTFSARYRDNVGADKKVNCKNNVDAFRRDNLGANKKVTHRIKMLNKNTILYKFYCSQPQIYTSNNICLVVNAP